MAALSIPIIILLFFVGILVIAAIWVMAAYNGLVALRQAVKNAWAQIDVQLKRRHDLIPNLVNTVKGYAAHEKDTFEQVIHGGLKFSVSQVATITNAAHVLLLVLAGWAIAFQSGFRLKTHWVSVCRP